MAIRLVSTGALINNSLIKEDPTVIDDYLEAGDNPAEWGDPGDEPPDSDFPDATQFIRNRSPIIATNTDGTAPGAGYDDTILYAGTGALGRFGVNTLGAGGLGFITSLASWADNEIPRWSGASTGPIIIQGSSIFIDDTQNITGVNDLTMGGDAVIVGDLQVDGVVRIEDAGIGKFSLVIGDEALVPNTDGGIIVVATPNSNTLFAVKHPTATKVGAFDIYNNVDTRLRTQVNGSAASDPLVVMQVAGTSGGTSPSEFRFNIQGPGFMSWYTNNTEKMRLTSTGDLTADGDVTVGGDLDVDGTITAGSGSTLLTTAAGLLRHQSIDPDIAGTGLGVATGILSVDNAAALVTLSDNSIADALHRHSELVASDGSPDPALSIDAVGTAIIGGGTSASARTIVSAKTGNRGQLYLRDLSAGFTTGDTKKDGTYVTSEGGLFNISGQSDSGTGSGSKFRVDHSTVAGLVSVFSGLFVEDDLQVGGDLQVDGVAKIGTATTVTPHVLADDLVIDSGVVGAGISILSTQTARIAFGDAGSNLAGSILYNHTSQTMAFAVESVEELIISETEVTIPSNDLILGGDTYWTGPGTGLPYSDMYVNDNTTVTSVSSAAFTQITVFDTNGHNNLATPDHTNDHITIVKAGVYMVDCCLTVANNSGAGHKIEIIVAKNNKATIFANCRRHRTLASGTDVGAIPICGHIDLDVDDTVEVWATSDSASAKNITIEDINLNLTMIGGT